MSFDIEIKRVEVSRLGFDLLSEGTNARKVISEVYAFFVLQCTVFGRKVNKRRIPQPDMESIFTKKVYEISGHRKLLCELLKLSKLNALILLGY